METIKRTGWIGAVLMALFLVVMPVAVFCLTRGLVTPHQAALAILSLVGLAGAVTVTYPYPLAGTTAAPTAVQAASTNMIVAQVVWADADTLALVTHNFGLLTVDFLSPNLGGTVNTPTTGQLFPKVTVTPLVQGAAISFYIPPTVTLGQNTVTIGKGSVTGSGSTLAVYIERPFSMLV